MCGMRARMVHHLVGTRRYRRYDNRGYRLNDLLRRAVLGCRKNRAQAFMSFDQRRESRFERGHVQWTRQPECSRDVIGSFMSDQMWLKMPDAFLFVGKRDRIGPGQ